MSVYELKFVMKKLRALLQADVAVREVVSDHKAWSLIRDSFQGVKHEIPLKVKQTCSEDSYESITVCAEVDNWDVNRRSFSASISFLPWGNTIEPSGNLDEQSADCTTMDNTISDFINDMAKVPHLSITGAVNASEGKLLSSDDSLQEYAI